MDDQSGVKIAEGDTVDTDIEGIIAHIHSGDGKGFPLQEIFLLDFIDGGEVIDRAISLVAHLPSGSLPTIER